MRHKIILAAILPLFVGACSIRPFSVLSEDRMEEIMYDLYIAEAEISENYLIFASDSARKKELLNTVFKKHGVTQAKFDSSLVWYAANLDKYLKINENLCRRYDALTDKLREQQSDSLAKVSLALSERNRYNIVNRSFFVAPADIPNGIYTFRADTLLMRNGGNYTVSFNIAGLSENLHPEFCFNIRCSDTVFIHRDTIASNGSYEYSVKVQPSKYVRELRGYFRFSNIENSELPFIYNLSVR